MSVRASAEGMLLGSVVADAATMGLHWIYDQQIIQDKLKVPGAHLAFHNPPSCPFYSYDQGKLSPYGDELVPYFDAFAASKSFNKEELAQKNYAFFKSYSGRLNHLTKLFVENWDNGKPWNECHVEDHQAQGFIKMPLAVARYGGSDALAARALDMVDLMQDSSISNVVSMHAARILERILLTGASPAEAIRWFGDLIVPTEDPASPHVLDVQRRYAMILSDEKMIAWTRFTVELRDLEIFPKMKLCAKLRSCYVESGDLSACLESVEMEENERAAVTAALERCRQPGDGKRFSISQEVAALGLSCALPDAYFASLLVALRSSSYQAAIEANIEAGGDNCSRGVLIGGLFGAWAPHTIPDEWKASVQPALWEAIQLQASKIVSFRDSD